MRLHQDRSSDLRPVSPARSASPASVMVLMRRHPHPRGLGRGDEDAAAALRDLDVAELLQRVRPWHEKGVPVKS